MCANNDLRAQTRISSRDVIRVMGGVALASLGLFVLGIALAIGWANHEIEAFRVALTVGAVISVIGAMVGTIAWSHTLLSKQLAQLVESACSCPAGTDETTVARLHRAGI